MAIDLDRSTVDEGLAAQSSLADYLAAHDLEVVNREGSVAWIYHQIRQATPDPVPEPVKTVLLPPNLITTRSTVRRADDNQQVTECRLDVWLHLDVIDPAPGSPQGDEYELAAEGEEPSNFVGGVFRVQTAPDPPTVVSTWPATDSHRASQPADDPDRTRPIVGSRWTGKRWRAPSCPPSSGPSLASSQRQRARRSDPVK
ncbi:MAG: hypothetical protein IPF42_15660 [Candidatus Microthrix sp.]|nr:hypothetical protein [Candidatus Microthrix sp.]